MVVKKMYSKKTIEFFTKVIKEVGPLDKEAIFSHFIWTDEFEECWKEILLNDEAIEGDEKDEEIFPVDVECGEVYSMEILYNYFKALDKFVVE